ncbi:MAG: UDP-N-acetylmuramoyl-tripeptide--D-alanyl-D-alanine ligase [Acidimicrobiales bacterium]
MSATSLALDALLGLGLAVAYACQLVRWLRVLQREHYEASAMWRFFWRWSNPPVASARGSKYWRHRPLTLSHVLLVALVVALALDADRWALLVTIVFGILAPRGLALKGRTGALNWTRRLRAVAVVASVLAAVIVSLGLASARPWLVGALVVWLTPALVGAATVLLAPYERRLAQRYVDQASARLARVNPVIVGITGSYGKTSTKNHLATLLADQGGVVSSPKSFNNRAGLSRTINEKLADDTRVLIAEMGTYGPGEIAELCSWCPPSIAVVTAIGPVHLERMKSLDVIESAKFEITGPASCVVLNVDDQRLARWVARLELLGKRVRTVGSSSATASVRVVGHDAHWRVFVDGEDVGSIEQVRGLQPTNVACAIGAALEVGVALGDVVARLRDLMPVANRSQVAVAASGATVIDDTFNANPASARAALSLLASLGLPGRTVVVTPGLIELGPSQFEENCVLAHEIETVGAQLVVVGRTNAKSLCHGYKGTALRFDTREAAVAWVRSSLSGGDGALYLNDLPDHYP